MSGHWNQLAGFFGAQASIKAVGHKICVFSLVDSPYESFKTCMQSFVIERCFGSHMPQGPSRQALIRVLAFICWLNVFWHGNMPRATECIGKKRALMRAFMFHALGIDHGWHDRKKVAPVVAKGLQSSEISCGVGKE